MEDDAQLIITRQNADQSFAANKFPIHSDNQETPDFSDQGDDLNPVTSVTSNDNDSVDINFQGNSNATFSVNCGTIDQSLLESNSDSSFDFTNKKLGSQKVYSHSDDEPSQIVNPKNTDPSNDTAVVCGTSPEVFREGGQNICINSSSTDFDAQKRTGVSSMITRDSVNTSEPVSCGHDNLSNVCSRGLYLIDNDGDGLHAIHTSISKTMGNIDLHTNNTSSNSTIGNFTSTDRHASSSETMDNSFSTDIYVIHNDSTDNDVCANTDLNDEVVYDNSYHPHITNTNQLIAITPQDSELLEVSFPESTDLTTDPNVQEKSESTDDQVSLATSKNARSSLPDSLPSRRSVRKKHTTFWDDFEYYTPIFKRKETKSEQSLSPVVKQTDDSDDDSNEDIDNEEENKVKKVAKKKKKRQVNDSDESEDSGDRDESSSDEESSSGQHKGKGVIKKRKEGSLKKVKKKKIKKEHGSEESDVDEVLNKQKRKKKIGVTKHDGKKFKVKNNDSMEDDSSDDDESTPISQLRDQLKKEKEETTPISQLRAEIQKKKKAEELSWKRKLEVQSVLERFGTDSFHSVHGSNMSPGKILKRKLSDYCEDIPSKMSKPVQIDKLAPALANLMKLHKSSDKGLTKHSTSKSITAPKIVPSAVDHKHASPFKDISKDKKSSSESKVISSDLKHKMQFQQNLPKKDVSSFYKKEQSVVAKNDGKVTSKEKHDSQTIKKVKTEEKFKPGQHLDENGKSITKVQIIRKSDGTIIKRKVIVSSDGRTIKEVTRKILKKDISENNEKKMPKIKNAKGGLPGQKLKPSMSINSDKKMGTNLVTKSSAKSGTEYSSRGVLTLKESDSPKKKSYETYKKVERPNQNVDDLLKRGIIHKRKRHQPFGNKNVKVQSKDSKSESIQNVASESDLVKKKLKVVSPKVHSPGSKMKEQNRIKKSGSAESSSPKGSKKKYEDNTKPGKKSSSSTNINEENDDGPPVLVPVTALGKHKVRHHKTEHELPMDMTMMDLFKPDNTLQQDGPKKEELNCDLKPWQWAETMSQYCDNIYNIESFIKLENIQNILIEHQYSKPIMSAADSNNSNLAASIASSELQRDNDIESISYKTPDFIDQNFPDRFLEESNEENAIISHESCPDAFDEAFASMNKRNSGDRPSILESLDNELKEGGTEFLIVGQVEIDRISPKSKDTSSSFSTADVHKIEESLAKDFKSSSQIRKSSGERRKSSVEGTDSEKGSSAYEHRKSSTDKKFGSDRKSGRDIDRQLSIDDKKSGSKIRTSSTEDKKYSSKDRKSSTDDKHRSKDRKSSTEDKKYSSKDKKSSHEDKKYSSKDKKSSSEDNKHSSKDRKSSSDDKKHSSIKNLLGNKNSDARQDSLDSRKDNIKKSRDGSDSRQKVGMDQGDDSEEEHLFKDDENDLDWEPKDTDMIYCICRKPHNNRFMICCDQCEEWFHGTCVGVSRARGKEMEEQEEEYICPVCQGGSLESTQDGVSTSALVKEGPAVKSKLLQRCVGKKCSKAPRPGSVYCSNECIMSHAQESLKAIREEQMKRKISEKPTETSRSPSQSSLTPSSSSVMASTVEVVERETGKVLAGTSAPTQKGLHRWLEQHPTFEVIQPHKHRSKGSSSKDKHFKSDRDKPRSEKEKQTSDKERHTDHNTKDSGKRSDSDKLTISNSHRSEERRGDGPDQIRINVRTAVKDCLIARAQESDDILLTSNEIKNLAVTIEEELYEMFNNTGHKYRNKYRSLVFNIKDQKNKGLFRKILTGIIKPHKLVQMSTEELASKELAKWREQASKHQLEMIEKTEQAAVKESEGVKHVRKKTHKGEIEVEDEDLSILETRLEEKKDVEPESQSEESQVPVLDTTDQHRAHLFDLNCRVCTGRVVLGLEEQRAMAIPDKVTSTPSEPDQIIPTPSEVVVRVEASEKEEAEDYDKAEEIVKEAMRTMQKMEESVSSLPRMLSTSPIPKEITPPQSPKLISRWEESASTSVSSVTSSSSSSVSQKKVVVRSPDSALQTGLESKAKFIPTGPMLWKGFLTMLDVAKFFTSAYRVSGPTDYITIPDTIKILGRISPDQMWDYLSKIRQAGSKDLTVVRFVPGSDDEKVAYVHLYSYLNSRSRCGVASNPNKEIKDFYIVPLASYGKIPRTLLPFDGPGLEENRPHMLIGILVRLKGKQTSDTADTNMTSAKPANQSSGAKSSNQSSTKATNQSSTKATNQSSTKATNQSSSSSSSKYLVPPVNRDPRLAKLVVKDTNIRLSPTDSSSSSSNSSNEVQQQPTVDVYEPEYIPMPKKAKSVYKPVAEYIPTPTMKKSHTQKYGSALKKNEKRKQNQGNEIKDEDTSKKTGKKDYDYEDDSDPYSPGKEAEAYSPSQEDAPDDDPYDPADGSPMNESDLRIISSSLVSSTIVSSSSKMTAAAPSAVSTIAGVSADSSLGVSESQSAPSVASVNLKDTELERNELVEKMAISNDPQEISSLMVAALSSAKSQLEQQRLLVELTKQVEERKQQLVEAAYSATKGDNRNDESDKINRGEIGAGIPRQASSLKATELKTTPRDSVLEDIAVEEAVSSSSTTPMPAPPSLLALNAQLSSSTGPPTSNFSSIPGDYLLSTISSASSSALQNANEPDTKESIHKKANSKMSQSINTSYKAQNTPSSSIPSLSSSKVFPPLPTPQGINEPDTKESIHKKSSFKMPQPLNTSTNAPSSNVLNLSSSEVFPPLPTLTDSMVEHDLSGQHKPTNTDGSNPQNPSIPGNILKVFNAKLLENMVSTETEDHKSELFDKSPSSQTLKSSQPFPQSSGQQAPSYLLASSSSAKIGSSVQLPDALKALMNDVMGNSQFSSLEKRRKLILKKEDKKAEVVTNESLGTDTASKDGSSRMVEIEGNEDRHEIKPNVNVKNTESASGSTDFGNNFSGGNTDDIKEKKEFPVIPPSINELLDRLKKGGFQFPLQKVENPGSLSAVVSTATQINDGVSSHTAVASSSATSSLMPFSSMASSTSNVDNKLEQPNLTSVLLLPEQAAISSSVVDPMLGLAACTIPPEICLTDGGLGQGQGSHQVQTVASKHPLDPMAFPSLLGESLVHSQVPPSLPRDTQNLPLHPGDPRVVHPQTLPPHPGDPRANPQAMPQYPGDPRVNQFLPPHPGDPRFALPYQPGDPRVHPQPLAPHPGDPRSHPQALPPHPGDQRFALLQQSGDQRFALPHQPGDPQFALPHQPGDPRAYPQALPKNTGDTRFPLPQNPDDPRFVLPQNPGDPRFALPQNPGNPRFAIPQNPSDPRFALPQNPSDPRFSLPPHPGDPRVHPQALPPHPGDPQFALPPQPGDPRVHPQALPPHPGDPQFALPPQPGDTRAHPQALPPHPGDPRIHPQALPLHPADPRTLTQTMHPHVGDPRIHTQTPPQSSHPPSYNPLHPHFPHPTSTPTTAWPNPISQSAFPGSDQNRRPEGTLENFPQQNSDFPNRNRPPAFTDNMPGLSPQSFSGDYGQYTDQSYGDTDNDGCYPSSQEVDFQSDHYHHPQSRDLMGRDRNREYSDRDRNMDYSDRERNRDFSDQHMGMDFQGWDRGREFQGWDRDRDFQERDRDFQEWDREREYSDRDRDRAYPDRDRNRSYSDRNYRSGRSNRSQNNSGSDYNKPRDDRRHYHRC